MVDSSGSLGQTNYRHLKKTVANMGAHFGVSPMGSHAAIILYSDNYDISTKLDYFLTPVEFERTALRLKYLRQRSRMDAALTAAHDRIFTHQGNARDFLPKVAILFTDGKQSRFRDRVPLPVAAKKLRDQGVNIYVIGIGRGPSDEELKSMVSDEKNHILRLNRFRNLEAESTAIAEKVCSLFGGIDCSKY